MTKRSLAAVWKAAALALITIMIASAALLAQGCACHRAQPDDGPIDVTENATEALPSEKGPEPTAAETEDAGPTATPEPEPVKNAMHPRDGGVVAIATGTYGVATDGSVRFMGRSVSGQCYISDWKNVVQLAANDRTTAALMEDGTIAVVGEQEADFAEAADWQDIVAIAMGDAHLVGLHSDGTVVAIGANNLRQCEVGDWTRVVRIYAGGNFTAAVTDEYGEGMYDTQHGGYAAALPRERHIIDAAVAEDHMAVLFEDGKVLTAEFPESSDTSRVDGNSAPASRDPFTELEWEGIEKIFAAEGATYGIDGSGKLYADDELVSSLEEEPEDVYSLSVSDKHIVLLHTDGTVTAEGDNTDLQCNVSVWRLLPYVTDDGYMLGGYVGENIGEEQYRTGLEVNYRDPATGEDTVVTAVLLGDINGDGAINQADLDLMNAYIGGRTQLEGAFLRAANVIDDTARPGSVDGADRDALRRHIEGKCAIDQYAKQDKYTTRLANAKRVNTDALGYLTINGTNIDYPLMYGENWYYHTRGLDGQEITRGSLYTYWAKPGKNIVITGHNARTSGTMLHQLHYIQDNYARNFSVYANRLWCINTYGTTGYWEVWSMYEEGAFSNPDNSSLYYNTCYPSAMDNMSDSQIQAWIQYQQNKNQLNYTVDVTPRDNFMTIVTCGDTHAASEMGSRLYFFLRWVSGT